MKYFSCFIFTVLFFGAHAQSSNGTAIQGPDSLNATFVPANMLSRYELAVVNSVDYIEIINVHEPTEVILFDLAGKIVYQNKIDKRTRIEKDQFAKGFYVIRTRSAKTEAVKKLYL